MDGPRPHRWARRVFQNGEIDDARQGVPAHARPWKPSARTCMLTRVCSSQCAGDARPSTPPPPPSSLPPLPPSPLPPRCCCRRRRCRHAAPMHVHGAAARTRRPGPAYGTSAVTEVAHVLLANGRSFVGSCDRDQWGAVEPSGSTLMRFATRVCVLSSVSCIVPWWLCEQCRSQLECYVEMWCSECSYIYALYQPPRPLFHS